MTSKSKVAQIVEESPEVWKTESAFWSWIKGGIRKHWNRHPSKLKLIKNQRKQIPNPNPKGNKTTVWGATCTICGKDYALKDMQVDHVLEDTAKLTKVEDIQSCCEKLWLVTTTDLRMLCSECHSVVSLSQKLGISFEEAKLEKEVIKFKSLNAKEQAEVLVTFDPKYVNISPAVKRVNLYRECLKNGI